MKYQILYSKKKKMSRLSSAAVIICTLRIYFRCLHMLQLQVDVNNLCKVEVSKFDQGSSKCSTLEGLQHMFLC